MTVGVGVGVALAITVTVDPAGWLYCSGFSSNKDPKPVMLLVSSCAVPSSIIIVSPTKKTDWSATANSVSPVVAG